MSDVDTPSATLEETQKKLEWMDVDIDLTKTDPSRYDAVIMCANYTSVRSRYFEAPEGTPVNPMLVQLHRQYCWVEITEKSSKFFGVFPLFLIDSCKPVLCYR